MRRFASLILLAACLVAGFALTAPANADARAKIGIADQKSSMFEDQRFRDLKVRFARISVPWDVLRYDFTREEVDLWMQRARAQGITPLVTLQRSRVRSHSRPTVAQYTREFKRFQKKYPFVKNYAAWNEPNLEDARRPKLIASYYKAMRANCKGCKVLAADLVDSPNMIRWTKQFLKYTKGKEPKYWGLHNYVGANRFSTKDTTALKKTVKGQIWLTETGGLVARRNKSKLKLRQGTAHAARVTRFVLQKWGNDPRIPFIFYYHWDSSSNKDTWDSAFISSDGKPRPSFNILKNAMRTRR